MLLVETIRVDSNITWLLKRSYNLSCDNIPYVWVNLRKATSDVWSWIFRKTDLNYFRKLILAYSLPQNCSYSELVTVQWITSWTPHSFPLDWYDQYTLQALTWRVGSHEMADKRSIKTVMDKWHQLVSLLAPQIIEVAKGVVVVSTRLIEDAHIWLM